MNCTKDMYLCICEVPRSPLNRLSVWLFQTLFLFCSDPEFARALYLLGDQVKKFFSQKWAIYPAG